MKSANLTKVIDYPIRCWIIFGLIALAVSPFISLNKSFAIDSVFTFLKLVVMCFSMVYIAKRNHSADFLITLMYATSIIYVVYMYWTGNLIGGRLAVVNANSDANVCLIGIVTGSLLIGKSKNRMIKIVIILSCVLMFYVGLMTGSRKSLICSLFYICFWIVVDLRTTWKTYKAYTKVAIIGIFLAAIYFLIKYGIPIFQSSTTYLRFSEEYAMRSDSSRIGLYKEAWDYFLQHPIFGIGYNQFRLYNSRGLYSHSTYTEILANTGIVGTILFFTPHIWCTKWLIRLAKESETYSRMRNILLLLVYMVSSLILALGMNQTNNERVLMMYSLMFACIILERERNKRAQ